MTYLARRDWVPAASEDLIQSTAAGVAAATADAIAARLDAEIARNRTIHERDCVNLNPATNVMNPKAEAALSAGLGTRPSLGYPGDRLIAEIGPRGHPSRSRKIIAFRPSLPPKCSAPASWNSVSTSCGSIANLYACHGKPAPDRAIAIITHRRPASAEHITHHEPGCAGLFRLDIHPLACWPAVGGRGRLPRWASQHCGHWRTRCGPG